jgi:hypothetical protein
MFLTVKVSYAFIYQHGPVSESLDILNPSLPDDSTIVKPRVTLGFSNQGFGHSCCNTPPQARGNVHAVVINFHSMRKHFLRCSDEHRWLQYGKKWPFGSVTNI